jgi:hypothetical protein
MLLNLTFLIRTHSLIVNSIAADCRLHKGKILKEKKKTGRPRAENPMVHTAVVLPPELIARLKADAEASGQGLSGEIRLRLQSTYLGDPETNRFLAAVRKLADMLARDLGIEWCQHSYALAAFKAGMAALLSRYVLDGDEKVRPDGEGNDPPEVVGRTYARLIDIDDDGL